MAVHSDVNQIEDVIHPFQAAGGHFRLKVPENGGLQAAGPGGFHGDLGADGRTRLSRHRAVLFHRNYSKSYFSPVNSPHKIVNLSSFITDISHRAAEHVLCLLAL